MREPHAARMMEQQSPRRSGNADGLDELHLLRSKRARYARRRGRNESRAAIAFHREAHRRTLLAACRAIRRDATGALGP